MLLYVDFSITTVIFNKKMRLTMLPITNTVPQQTTLPAIPPAPQVAEEEVAPPISFETLTDSELIHHLEDPSFPWPDRCPKEICARIIKMAHIDPASQDQFIMSWLQACAQKNSPALAEHKQIVLCAQLFIKYKFNITEGSYLSAILQAACNKTAVDPIDRKRRLNIEKLDENTTQQLLFILLGNPSENMLGHILQACETYPIERVVLALALAADNPYCRNQHLCDLLINMPPTIESLFICSYHINLPITELVFEYLLQHNPMIILEKWAYLSEIQREQVSSILRGCLKSDLAYLVASWSIPNSLWNFYQYMPNLTPDWPTDLITPSDLFSSILESIKNKTDNKDILEQSWHRCLTPEQGQEVYNNLNTKDLINLLIIGDPIRQDTLDKLFPHLMEMSSEELSTLMPALFKVMSEEQCYCLVCMLHDKGFTNCISDTVMLGRLLTLLFNKLHENDKLHYFLDFIEPIKDKTAFISSCLRLPYLKDQILLEILLNKSEEIRNRCLDCGLWRLNPSFVKAKCNQEALLEHAPECLNLSADVMVPALLNHGALLEDYPKDFLNQHSTLIIDHFLDNNPENLMNHLSLFSTIEDQERIIYGLIEKHPVLARKIQDKLSIEQQDLLLKKLIEVDPQVAEKDIHTILGINLPHDMSKETAATYCALYLHICYLKERFPNLAINIMGRCTSYLNSHGVSTSLARQADYRKLFQILLDGLDPCIDPEDKHRLAYLLAERSFKDYRRNREQIWKALVMIGDAPLSFKEKRKLLHHLAQENPQASRFENASRLLKKANLLLLINIIAQGLNQWENAEQILSSFIQQALPSMPQNFLEFYIKTFNTWQDPYALIQYISQLNGTLDPSLEKTHLLQGCAQFIQAIFDGPQAWQELRHAKTKHMNEVERLSSPQLLEMWSQEVELPMLKLLTDTDDSASAPPNLKEIFYTALIADNHLPDLDSLLPRLHAILTNAPTTEIAPPPLPPIQKLEDLIIESISHPIESKEDAIQKLRKIETALTPLPNCARSQFATDIHDLIQQLDTSCTKPTSALQVVETDDPEMLFLAPTLIPGSCQSVYARSSTNRCLMGFVLDPKNRMIIVKTPEGRPVARGILRLMLTQTNTGPGAPALFLERLYPQVLDPQIKDAIIAMAKHKAKLLGIPLHVSWQTLPPQAATQTPQLLVSIDSAAPLEYADSAIDMFNPYLRILVPMHQNTGSYFVPQNEIQV